MSGMIWTSRQFPDVTPFGLWLDDIVPRMDIGNPWIGRGGFVFRIASGRYRQFLWFDYTKHGGRFHHLDVCGYRVLSAKASG